MSENQTVPEVKCPKCGSNQVFAGKKGFSGTKAVGGAILTGGIGLLAGTIGSNKIKITCLACGNVFRPGDIVAKQNAVKQSQDNAALEKLQRIRRLFIKEYETTENKDEVFQRLKENDPGAVMYANAEIAYKAMKREQSIKSSVNVVFVILIIILIGYFATC